MVLQRLKDEVLVVLHALIKITPNKNSNPMWVAAEAIKNNTRHIAK